MPDFQAWTTRILKRTEAALEDLLPPATVAPERLHAAMRYAVLGGGKRVRPLLVHAAGEVCAASSDTLDSAACAVELIHAYSLVHDDMPCMDDDVLRRGKPTIHVQYDEATALLAGDALQTLAFHALSRPALLADAAVQAAMIHDLALAAGSRGMAGGQAIDLASVGRQLNRSELEFMHIHKTGALIRCAVMLGARCGAPLDRGQVERLDRFGKLVGLLFQVVDDILDADGDTATLGKTAGKDAAHDKPTYVSLLGLARSRAYASELLDEAVGEIAPLPASGRLADLARFVVHRRF